MAQSFFHSAAVTGCTDRREFLTSTMDLSEGSALISASVTGRGRPRTAATSTHSHWPVPSVEFGMGLLHHLDDADHAPLFAGMVEEGEIAAPHRAHIVARLEVAHAVPLGAFAPLLFLLVPGPGVEAPT